MTMTQQPTLKQIANVIDHSLLHPAMTDRIGTSSTGRIIEEARAAGFTQA